MNIVATQVGHKMWYAVDDDTYDGAPDSSPRARMIGMGDTAEQAIERLKEQIADWEADQL